MTTPFSWTILLNDSNVKLLFFFKRRSQLKLAKMKDI